MKTEQLFVDKKQKLVQKNEGRFQFHFQCLLEYLVESVT